MKIGMFTTPFWPHETVAGVSNTVYLLARKLIEDFGCETWIYAPNNGDQKAVEDLPGMHIRRFDLVGPRIFSGFRAGNINEKFDVAHSFHYGFYPASLGLRQAKKDKVPHFLTTAYHSHRLSMASKALFWLYNTTKGRRLLEDSTVLPFNNNEMKQLLSIAKAKYVPTPSPINTDIFYPKRKKNRQLTVGYVGNFLPWKGAGVAMDICKQIETEGHDVKFLFVGRGQMEKEMKSKASQNFRFMKDLPISKLAECYNEIDVFVYPTLYESFGRVLAEAVTCGSAVVSTRVGAVPETVGGGGLLTEYGDWKGMKENVVKLIENKGLRKKLSKAGVRHSKSFDYNTVAKNVFRMYREQAGKL